MSESNKVPEEFEGEASVNKPQLRLHEPMDKFSPSVDPNLTEPKTIDDNLEPLVKEMSCPLTTESSVVGLRRGGRDHNLTDKARQNLEEEIERRTKHVRAVYEQWRQSASTTRKSLRTMQPLEQLHELHMSVNKYKDLVVKSYEGLRKITAPNKEIVAKVDNCCSISNDLLETLMRLRLEPPKS